MTSTLQSLYYRAPQPLRTAAASLRGFYLQSRRYGLETDRLVDEILDRETWSEARWDTWRAERLGYLLHRAATRVPYYREYWSKRRARGDRSSWDQLENWPVLEKEDLRSNPIAFVADDCDRRKMHVEHTSGSTGKPLTLWISSEAIRMWYALFETRCRNWYGLSRKDRWAILGGQLVVPPEQQRPPFWVWNAGMKQLYLSSYHLRSDWAQFYLSALKDYRITYLMGYTSSLHALALDALEIGRPEDLQMRIAITNAEPLTPDERAVIAKAFRCPVVELYGMAELVAGASTCPAGSFHLWPEAGYVEILDENGAISLDSTGDLICTGLLNADMPLIRYRVGDRGAAPQSQKLCACGRSLPFFSPVEGRSDDVLVTTDGRRVGRLDLVFKADIPIREAQIIQESLSGIRLRYVPAAGFNDSFARTLVANVRERLGPVEVILEPMDRVPRGPNGKFRAVVCKLPPDELRQARATGRSAFAAESI